MEIGDDALEMCQALLRIDTTNPPGNERPAADYLDGKLREVGYQTTLLESGPGRANLVCRRPGGGKQAPLLLTAHLDVVEAHAEHWRQPPFSGVIAEGCLWGRGAIDMKNMAAMSAAVMRRLAREQVALDRDVIFAAVADEEAGCDFGSRFLVEQHAELVRAEYAIGESGGFSMHIGGSTFYPIQVAEKGLCWIRARVRGEPGHGSMPRSDSAVVVLAEAVARLGNAQLPVHPTRWVRDFLSALAARQPVLVQPLVKLLTHPRLLPTVLRVFPDKSVVRGLQAVLSNTASPTVLSAGAKINVIPDKAEVLIDGRTLPGQSDQDLLDELREVMGPDVELEIMRSAPPVVTEPVDSPLYEIIAAEIQKREPDATVVPYMIPGFTDAKYFTRMGARWYGFSPVKIEKASGIRFADMFHGHNERVPVDGLRWGADLLYSVVLDFCRA
ncbi:MAG TPA: M20/M25/M40 family metallo-hydrolase [Kofleriaceae bacterium]|nr:M20/M25/M40 family metallo-hydrolase [Kofleriaceae bacterium]